MKEYITPAIKLQVMEEQLMGINSPTDEEGDGDQLGKGAQFDDEQEGTGIPKEFHSVWEE